jgi:hypothetical protein
VVGPHIEAHRSHTPLGTSVLTFSGAKEGSVKKSLLTPVSVLRKVSRVALSRYYLRSCSAVGSLPRVWGKPRIINRGPR